MGVSFSVIEDDLQKQAMEKAGFVDVEVKNIKVCVFLLLWRSSLSLVNDVVVILTPPFQVPIGSWPKDARPKELGVFTQAALEQDVEGYILFTTNALGWTREQIMVYM